MSNIMMKIEEAVFQNGDRHVFLLDKRKMGKKANCERYME